ncbi:MAG TPA: SPOR domain-containing protein [Gemmatimonadaceae bacterium]|jgi:cell division septation protein DedD
MPLRFLRIAAIGFVACLAGAPGVASAQARAAHHVLTPDSVYAHAKQLVVNGNGAAGRLLVDSMVAAADPGTPAYAEALYWRASLSASMKDAERDLQRIVIEYPLAPRSADALLQLGQLEAMRGDNAAAETHLARFLLENPASPEQGRAGLQLVRIAFEQNDAREGCIALGRALHAVPTDQIELRNQLQYYSPRCAGVDTTNTPKPETPPGATTAKAKGKVAPTTATKTTSKGTAKPAAKATGKAASDSTESTDTSVHSNGGSFTLQVAAYSSKPEADALAKKLAGRGLDTYVVGTKKPFRVQVGRYPTRAAATAAAKKLEARNVKGFITTVAKDDE